MKPLKHEGKWIRWNQQKTEKFLKIVIINWTEKLKKEIYDFRNNQKSHPYHLKPRDVKNAALLMGIKEEESKSLQIKFIRIIKSFPKKKNLAVKLEKLIEYYEENINQINENISLTGQPANNRFHDIFNRNIREAVNIILPPKDESKVPTKFDKTTEDDYNFIREFYQVPLKNLGSPTVQSPENELMEEEDSRLTWTKKKTESWDANAKPALIDWNQKNQDGHDSQNSVIVEDYYFGETPECQYKNKLFAQPMYPVQQNFVGYPYLWISEQFRQMNNNGNK